MEFEVPNYMLSPFLHMERIQPSSLGREVEAAKIMSELIEKEINIIEASREFSLSNDPTPDLSEEKEVLDLRDYFRPVFNCSKVYMKKLCYIITMLYTIYDYKLMGETYSYQEQLDKLEEEKTATVFSFNELIFKYLRSFEEIRTGAENVRSEAGSETGEGRETEIESTGAGSETGEEGRSEEGAGRRYMLREGDDIRAEAYAVDILQKLNGKIALCHEIQQLIINCVPTQYLVSRNQINIKTRLKYRQFTHYELNQLLGDPDTMLVLKQALRRKDEWLISKFENNHVLYALFYKFILDQYNALRDRKRLDVIHQSVKDNPLKLRHCILYFIENNLTNEAISFIGIENFDSTVIQRTIAKGNNALMNYLIELEIYSSRYNKVFALNSSGGILIAEEEVNTIFFFREIMTNSYPGINVIHCLSLHTRKLGTTYPNLIAETADIEFITHFYQWRYQ